MLTITELNAPSVVAALYNKSSRQGLGMFMPEGVAMSEEAAKEELRGHDFYINRGAYFDYLNGRVMKVEIVIGQALDFRLYDRDNGPGAGARAVKAIGKMAGGTS